MKENDMPDGRPQRLCDVCGQLDDHPRHVTSVPEGFPGAVPSKEFLDNIHGAPASAVAELMSPTTVVRHIDCCAETGCDICQATEKITGGVRGQSLLNAIRGGALKDFDTTGMKGIRNG